jgi:hypothetical protein
VLDVDEAVVPPEPLDTVEPAAPPAPFCPTSVVDAELHATQQAMTAASELGKSRRDIEHLRNWSGNLTVARLASDATATSDVRRIDRAGVAFSQRRRHASSQESFFTIDLVSQSATGSITHHGRHTCAIRSPRSGEKCRLAGKIRQHRIERSRLLIEMQRRSRFLLEPDLFKVSQMSGNYRSKMHLGRTLNWCTVSMTRAKGGFVDSEPLTARRS